MSISFLKYDDLCELHHEELMTNLNKIVRLEINKDVAISINSEEIDIYFMNGFNQKDVYFHLRFKMEYRVGLNLFIVDEIIKGNYKRGIISGVINEVMAECYHFLKKCLDEFIHFRNAFSYILIFGQSNQFDSVTNAIFQQDLNEESRQIFDSIIQKYDLETNRKAYLDMNKSCRNMFIYFQEIAELLVENRYFKFVQFYASHNILDMNVPYSSRENLRKGIIKRLIFDWGISYFFETNHFNISIDFEQQEILIYGIDYLGVSDSDIIHISLKEDTKNISTLIQQQEMDYCLSQKIENALNPYGKLEVIDFSDFINNSFRKSYGVGLYMFLKMENVHIIQYEVDDVVNCIHDIKKLFFYHQRNVLYSHYQLRVYRKDNESLVYFYSNDKLLVMEYTDKQPSAYMTCSTYHNSKEKLDEYTLNKFGEKADVEFKL